MCNRGARAAGSGDSSGARSLQQMKIAIVSLGQYIGSDQNPVHILPVFTILTFGARGSVDISPGGPNAVVIFCRVH